MHPAIGKINWVYFREGIDDFEKSLTGLLELLNRHADYVAPIFKPEKIFRVRSIEESNKPIIWSICSRPTLYNPSTFAKN